MKYFCFIVIFTIATAGLFAQAKELQIYFNDRPPLYMVKGETGFLAEISKLIFKEAQVPYRFVDSPSNRVLADIQVGKVYAVGLGWFKNPDRESWSVFSLPIYQDLPQVLVVRKTKVEALGAKPTLAGALKSSLALGWKDGYSFGAAVDAMVKDANPKISKTTVDIPQLLAMINAGRADYTILGREEASYLIKNDTALNELVLVSVPDAPEGNLRYLMFSKAVDQAVVDKINVAIPKVLASAKYKTLTTF